MQRISGLQIFVTNRGLSRKPLIFCRLVSVSLVHPLRTTLCVLVCKHHGLGAQILGGGPLSGWLCNLAAFKGSYGKSPLPRLRFLSAHAQLPPSFCQTCQAIAGTFFQPPPPRHTKAHPLTFSQLSILQNAGSVLDMMFNRSIPNP